MDQKRHAEQKLRAAEAGKVAQAEADRHRDMAGKAPPAVDAGMVALEVQDASGKGGAGETNDSVSSKTLAWRVLALLLVVVGAVMNVVDVVSDVRVYQEIGAAEDLERANAEAAHSNLTSALLLSPYSEASNTTRALVSAFENMTAQERNLTCNSGAAAARLAGDDYLAAANELGHLRRASLAFIVISFLPLFLSLYFSYTAGKTDLNRVKQERRTVQDAREGVEHDGYHDDKIGGAAEYADHLACSQVLTQLLEDIPQSVVAAIYVTALFRPAGAMCNSCFRTSALTGVLDPTGCALLHLGPLTSDESEGTTTPVVWMDFLGGTAGTLLLSLFMSLVSVIQSGYKTGHLLLFEQNGPSFVPRGMKGTNCENSSGKGVCKLVFVLLLLVWLLFYAFIAGAPLAGAVYFYVEPELATPAWMQSPSRDGVRSSLLAAFVIGILFWFACLCGTVVGVWTGAFQHILESFAKAK